MLTVLAPVAHPAHCTASGGLELATAGEVASFELIAHDAHGKRMGYGGEQYSVRLQRIGGLGEGADGPTPARGRGGGGSGADGGGGRGPWPRPWRAHTAGRRRSGGGGRLGRRQR